MDDLDRMFRRLVQNVRNGFPEYLAQPFEVSELYQTLIPYRHNRRELELETNQDYEMVLCRLLTGERGFLTSDPALADTVKREIGTSNPNTAIYREFAASRVTLSPAALRQFDETGGVAVSTAGARASAGSNSVSPTSVTPPRGFAPITASGSAPAPQPIRNMTAGPSPVPGAVDGACRYCGGSLPGDRRSRFCPHCGQNLTIQRCPACGTELDLAWKFCISCGRGVGAS